MDPHARHNLLLEVLATRGRASVDELAQATHVSPATVRRDLDELAQQQLLTRTRGGAVAHGVSYALPLRYKAARHADEKTRIAAAAATLVTPGAVVGINGGTTVTEVARAIALEPDLGASDGNYSVTIVTNAVNIASELCVRPHIRIVVTGGAARSQSYELIGPLAAASLAEIYLDIAFVGVNAFDPQDGATADHDGEAEINRLIAARAKRVVVVADSTKLGKRSLSKICATSQVHHLITDADADPALIEQFRSRGLEVTLA